LHEQTWRQRRNENYGLESGVRIGGAVVAVGAVGAVRTVEMVRGMAAVVGP
jgi:hypothetical protein